MSDTAFTLPDGPVDFAFCPAYDFDDTPQQIRIVIRNMPGFIPTAMVALTVADAEHLCDRLNELIGHDREAWSALAASSMRDGCDTDQGLH